jgi:putative ABC transport system substrate-binding protein
MRRRGYTVCARCLGKPYGRKADPLNRSLFPALDRQGLTEEPTMPRTMIGLIIILSLSILLGPDASEAQQAGNVWRIGLFHVGLDHVPPSLDSLREGLKALGYEEGKNLHLDWRNLPDEEAARETAQAFVRDRVDLIVAFENQTVRAVRGATADIPVVFLHVTDPVAAGFVSSLSHPGGNLTGFTGFRDLLAKQLELFKEIVPHLRRVLVLSDPEDPVTPRHLAEVRQAAEGLQLTVVEREASDQAGLEQIFSSLTRDEVDGVFPVSPNLQTKFSPLMIRLASERKLPAPSHRKEFVAQGALFSYGPDYPAVGRDAARYVDKILKGAQPAELPVERMSQLALVVNLKTAQTLGLTIPPTLLFQAAEVIREVHQEGESAPDTHPHHQK